ncbi:hypothetical protein RHGRI_017326 [Rhododendron griersonianum]|uniref:MULE transposase domain-containing protein n=1 Tax=Rhododendron griersonianum TaxID=479676 RepID=A0AAV6JXC6_9ERIC|nr:hypothetical protein RHGRI_017326 [Rhododendron griersonianum]
MMEGETQDVGGLESDFTDEDFAEINAIINLAATSNFEEISEFYESSEGVNYANNARESGSVEKKMLNDAECASLLEENFSTRDELLDRIRNMALKGGYVTTIKKSKPGCYVIIGCDRGGKYRGTSVPLSEGKRMSGSRLVNCPFQILGKKKVGKPWKVEIKDVSHNHEPSSDMSGHPICRRFSKEEVEGTHLFFAHPSSIALTKSYPYVFVMDCTYKTNKYKMPLLDIVGVSSFNGSFYSCFAFMQKEEEGDYVWALERFKTILGPDQQPSVILSDRELALMNAIEVVFPGTTNILCVWHIEKNVLSKCKPKFEREQDWETFLSDWTNLVESPDESCFNKAWQRLQVVYKEKEYVCNYIKNTWLPFKEKFVKAWTGNHLHFGNHVTSRAEGAHAMLKRYLTVSTGNFHEVREKICLAIENQHHEIKTKIASEKLRVIHKFQIPMFKEFVTHVSIFALSELLKQYELAASS